MPESLAKWPLHSLQDTVFRSTTRASSYRVKRTVLGELKKFATVVMERNRS